MEAFHRHIFELACKVAGDSEFQLFTLHKAILPVLGYDWWDPPGFSAKWVLQRIVHPILYVLLMIVVSVLTIHRSFYMDINNSLDFFIFMNNIICVFTFMYAVLKTIYMKLFFGKEAKELIDLVTAIGDMKTDNSGWENALKAFTYYFGLLTGIVGLWGGYFLMRWGCFPYATSYPWDQTTPLGFFAAFISSITTASYCGLVHSSIDSIISVTCGIIISHLETVKKDLRSIGQPGNHDWGSYVNASELHVKLIKAADKMNSCFHVLFAVQSVYTVLHACVIIFTFVKAEDVFGAICSTMPMLIASYAQLFMYCYFGQRLTSSFEELTFASYNNCWYRASMDVRKGLILFSRQSRRTIAVRGLGSFIASYDSYLSSFKESISYYLILKTITSASGEE